MSPKGPSDQFNVATVGWSAFGQLLQIQQQQWQCLLAWHESLLVMQRDLHDQWLSRWAGGARLDD